MCLGELSIASQNDVLDRIFVVQVALHQGPPLKRVELTARAQPCVVDRTIRFFEAEGTPLEKAMALVARPPTALRSAIIGGPAGVAPEKQYVYCTDKDVHVQRRDENEVLLRLMAPEAPKTRSFFLISYSDPFFSQVVAVQLVEVQGLRCEHLRVTVGQSVDRMLAVAPVEVLDAHSVRIFSSDPEMVAVQPVAEVDPRFGAKFVVTVTAMRAGARACRIHAVDPAMRRRVAAFLLVIAADLPDVRTVHEITLPVLETMIKRLAFKNEATRPMRYVARSSEPAIVTVRTPELMLAARETRYIELLFHKCPATLSYNTEVFLFVISEDRAIQETRLLQLSYT